MSEKLSFAQVSKKQCQYTSQKNVEREFGIHEKCTVVGVVTKIYKKLVSANIDRSNCNRCSLTVNSVAFLITMPALRVSRFHNQERRKRMHQLAQQRNNVCDQCQIHRNRMYSGNLTRIQSRLHLLQHLFLEKVDQQKKRTRKYRDPGIGPIVKAVH